MDFKNLYERVNRNTAMSQSEFIARADQILSEIVANYGEKYVYDGAVYYLVDKLQNLSVKPQWEQVIYYGILGFVDQNSYIKYQNLSTSTFHTVYREGAKGKRIKRWGYV